MEEIWRDVPDYEGLYQVSNLGRVKSLTRIIYKKDKPCLINEKILTPGTKGKGYYGLKLCKYNKKKSVYIHHLVAISFLGHQPNGYKMVIDHINDDKSDNRVDNLQIVTQRFNVCKTQGRYSSKYKGVLWEKHANSWRARITINNKIHHLGMFKDEYDAHLAYQNALKNLEQ